MAREDDFKALLIADGTLTALLTGGIYTYGAVGLDGITIDSASGAFDSGGDLKPSAMVKQRDLIPDGDVDDKQYQDTSATQIIEIYFYQERGYNIVDQATARSFVLLQGHIFSDSFEAEWVGTVDRLKDEGALSGASLVRQDWAVTTIL